MIMLTSTVYLQLRRESYNSVTFSLQLLSRIAAFHQYIFFFYCLSLDTSYYNKAVSAQYYMVWWKSQSAVFEIEL